MYGGGGVMPGRRAGSGVGKYNAKSPKQGSKRFNSTHEDGTLCPSRHSWAPLNENLAGEKR